MAPGSVMQSVGMSRSDGLIPLVVGVTGHRNPDEAKRAWLQAQCEEFLSRIARAAPHSPIVVLTPLARGCDRIAARAALAFKESCPARSIEIFAPLPLPLDDYCRDFGGDPADAAEFHELLAKVDLWYSLPGPDEHEGGVPDPVPPGHERDLRYRRLGMYLALQSQVMVAMWDGVHAGKVGGTADVVDFCLGARSPGMDCGVPFRCGAPLLAPIDKTPLMCIPTPREGGPAPTDQASRMGIEACLGEAAAAIRAIDDLNAQIARVTPNGPRAAALPDPDEPGATGPWRSMKIRFMRLDALAGRKKRAQMQGAKVIPLLAALGIASFQWFGSLGLERFRPYAWISLLAYLICIAAAAVVWRAMTRHHRTEWTFVHARALTEAMRVQLAWTGSGIPEMAPDLFLARRSSEVSQLRVILRAAVLECGPVAASGGAFRQMTTGTAWVTQQEAYFDGSSPGMRRRQSQVAIWSRVLTGLRVCVVLLSLLLLFDSIPGALDSGLLAGQEAVLCFVVACALAVTVAVAYWQHVTLDREDLEVASRMRHVFARASRLLAEGAADPREVLRAAGREALDEHAEWFSRHQERLRVPDVG